MLATPRAPVRDDFQSASVDAIDAYLAKKQYRFRPARGADRESGDGAMASILRAILPGLDLFEISYGRAAETVARPERADFALHVPLAGAIRWRGRREDLVCGGTRAVMTSSAERQTAQVGADCRRLVVCARREAVTAMLATMLGEAVMQPLAFTPALDFAEPRYRALVELSAIAQRELASPGAMLGNPLALGWFEQALLSALILFVPHSYSDRLAEGGAAPAPRDVKRAADYIEAHLDLPLTLAEIAAAAGVPGRTLRHHFRRFKGLAPMAYVRKLRLERVRRDLEAGDETDSVTAAARRWGFDHLGRFAGDYKKSFGVAPSVTLRGARGR
jgi:AraC-like DNA-binding protein